MTTLVAYSEASSEEEETTSEQKDLNARLLSTKKKLKLEIAPLIVSKETTLAVPRLIDPTQKVLYYNPKVEEFSGVDVGPHNPYKTRQEGAIRNILTGYVEDAAFSEFAFEEQRRTFEQLGYAADPAMALEAVGDTEKAKSLKNATIYDSTLKIKHDRPREDYGDVSDVNNFRGVWRKYTDEQIIAAPTKEEQELLDSWKEKATSSFGVKGKPKDFTEKSVLHCTCHVYHHKLKETHDYQGRTFMETPKGVGSTRLDDPSAVPERCFLPKKHIYTWTGHTKGVAVIRLFPISGHLLLSGGMDSKIKLWEYYGQRRCIRTYVGHFEAVVDLCFNNDGTKFLSCSFDKYIKLWNTETGECLSRFSTGKVPRCVRFNPAPDKQHMFVAGCKDKKIVQWDINTGEVVQEYDRHLGAVNTVTFTEEGNRFVSTSDDQSIRVWEWEIPVDFKYIAEPTQHSMPKTAIHPNGKWICFQSMDNFIYVFSASGRYRQHKKKRFSGHLTAGYACDVNFSPDGNYVISGDYEGRLVIWDWKSGKLYSKMDCHKQVTIGCIWHPHEPSQVVTCSWDGTIKLWD